MTLEASLLDHALDVARRAATAAAEVIQVAAKSNFDTRIKADQTPVTEVDEASERVIRQVIGEAFPDHAIYGEEQGRSGDSEFLWLVDPIDGTRSFVRRQPMYSTQIALMYRGRLWLGVSSAPAFGEMAWARRGGGAFLDGQPIHVSGCREVRGCTLSTGNLGRLAAGPRWSTLGELVGEVERMRGYGDFFHYHLLARGALDAVIESDVNILDIAALAVIVEEAGGRFSDLDGAALDLDTRSVLATATPELHEQLCARMTGWR